MYLLRILYFVVLVALPAMAQEIPLKLPNWLEVGAELRGRLEVNRATNFRTGNDDTYYLHRVRASLTIKPVNWLRFLVEIHETEAPAHKNPPSSGLAEGTDFLNANVEISGSGDSHWGLRAGRQRLQFGGDRLVGVSNWTNASRSFDAVRLWHETKTLRVDWFTSTLVQLDRRNWDHFTTRAQLHGMNVRATSWIPKGVAETYLFVKIAPVEASETGRSGRTQLYTPGLRLTGALPYRLSYVSETILQWGRIGGDTQRAWAGVWNLTYAFAAGASAPRLMAGYNHASGDKHYGDGRRGTFDTLYPTGHSVNGLSDRIGFRNLHELEQQFTWRLLPTWTFHAEHHSFWLASTQDAFYNSNGSTLVRNTHATSSHAGEELDILVTHRPTEHFELILGGGTFFPGQYLHDSTEGVRSGIFFAQWRYIL